MAKKRTKLRKKCRYVDCVRLAGPRSKECGPCKQRYKYWDGKSVAHRLERRRKLALSGETMSEFVSDTKLRAHEKKLHRKEVKEYVAAQTT